MFLDYQNIKWLVFQVSKQGAIFSLVKTLFGKKLTDGLIKLRATDKEHNLNIDTSI